jgi:hypothetical protein
MMGQKRKETKRRVELKEGTIEFISV